MFQKFPRIPISQYEIELLAEGRGSRKTISPNWKWAAVWAKGAMAWRWARKPFVRPWPVLKGIQGGWLLIATALVHLDEDQSWKSPGISPDPSRVFGAQPLQARSASPVA
jgi:hypothetical protein